MVLFNSVDFNAGAYISNLVPEISASNWQSLAHQASQYLTTTAGTSPRLQDLDSLVRLSQFLSSQASVTHAQLGNSVQQFLTDDQSAVSKKLLGLIHNAATDQSLSQIIDNFSVSKLGDILEEVTESLVVRAQEQTNAITSCIQHAPGKH